MGFLGKLAQLYDTVKTKGLEGGIEMNEPGHIPQTAHLIVKIDKQGRFQGYETMPPKTLVIVPILKARTNNILPLPLADKIEYVGGDYTAYGGEKEHCDVYLREMKAWCEHPQATEEVKAVYRYVERKCLVKDLVDAGVLPYENGKIIKTLPDGDVAPVFALLPPTSDASGIFICWEVEGVQTWKSPQVRQSWRDYLKSQPSRKGLCMVSGEKTVLTDIHQGRLRHPADGAKLISASDEKGLRYLGRFTSGDQVCGIGWELSEKAHNALRWLIARQGIKNGEQVTVLWTEDGQEPPFPLEDGKHVWEMDAEEDGLGLEESYLLYQSMKGFPLPENYPYDKIMLLTLDAPTVGRLAVTAYEEYPSERYFEHLRQWQEDFSWPFKVKVISRKEGKETFTVRERVFAPSLKMMIHAAFGDNIQQAMYKKLFREGMDVICGGHACNLPYYWVENAFKEAVGFHDKNWRRQRAIAFGCALYNGWLKRQGKKVDKESRSYLYGRLAALAEYTESYMLYVFEKERETNSQRLFRMMTTHPERTWPILKQKIDYARKRLSLMNMETWEDRQEQIETVLAETVGSGLVDPSFLHGYFDEMKTHSQWVAQKKGT